MVDCFVGDGQTCIGLVLCLLCGSGYYCPGMCFLFAFVLFVVWCLQVVFLFCWF